MSPPAPTDSKWWMAPVVILAVSAVAVAAILISRPQLGGSASPAPAAVAGKWSEACPGAKSADFTCMQEHYKALVAGKGVAAAFVDIKDAYEKDGAVKGNCHQLVHVIGRAAGDKFGDVAKAYGEGDDFCWSGYYHGVMEAVIGKIGYSRIKEEINTVCASVGADKKYTFYHYNCVHGLGHGVMAVSQSELFDSLKMCDGLTDMWERESCFGGVFMENVMAEANPHHKTKYLKSDDPVYPCNAVDRPYKNQCFGMQTSYALKVVGYDFGKVFAMCDAVETDFRNVCYQSLGRDASGNTISSPEPTRDICMKGRDYEARNNCVTGAVKDFISYHHSNEAGQKLCAVLETALHDSCTAVAASYNVGTK
jgi:hypothetical protein